MPSFTSLYNSFKLQIAKNTSPYRNLGMLPNELTELLKTSSFKEKTTLCLLIENVNYSISETKELEISDAYIDDLATLAICGAVNGNKVLTQVSLKNCALSAENAKLITSALNNCPSLDSLEFVGDDFGDEGVAEIVKAINLQSKLRSLKLIYTGLAEKAAQELETLIKTKPSFKTLTVEQSSLSTSAQDTLRNSSTIKSDFNLQIKLPKLKPTTKAIK